MSGPVPSAEDVIAEALAAPTDGHVCNVCTGWSPSWDGHSVNPPCRVTQRVAAVVAAIRGMSPAQRAQLDIDRYQPGPHDRITRDDAMPPSGPPPKGTLDEVVLAGVDVHLERMDDGWYWLGLTKGAGSRSLRVALGIGLRHGTRRRVVDAWVSDESGTDLHLIPERTDEDPS